MNKEFVPYEQALALKELGFDEPCIGKFYTKPKSKMFGVDEKGRHYPIKNTSKKLYTLGKYFVLNEDNVIIAPLYQQAFRWFREKYQLAVDIRSEHLGYYTSIVDREKMMRIVMKPVNIFETYEEAEQVCLDKLIKIVKLRGFEDLPESQSLPSL